MHSRRDFLRQLSMQTGGLVMLSSGISVMAFENDILKNPKEMKSSQNKKLGIALVGLGDYSTNQLAPSLEETEYCKLAGIVTGTPEKAEKWKNKYDIPDQNIYNYENFDSIKDNKDIDIVYIVLPTAMHAEYTIKAAKAGKHVICEKPMAMDAKECEQMIKACKDANRMLSIGYRLHFDAHNLEMVRLGKERPFGKIKHIKAENCMLMKSGTWRTDKELGGGPVRDAGIYCVQGCIYTLGKVPIAVTAKEGEKTDLEKFKEVEESMTWKLEFPDGVTADCKTSYAEIKNVLRAESDNGWFELSPAYEYDGLKGKTSKGKIEVAENPKKQQALQMDDFAQCILNKRPTKVPGEMGLRDIKILTAIFESAKTGKRIPINI